MSIKKLVTTALMAAILFISQIVFAPLPNIELVSFLVIMYTLVFGVRQTMVCVYVFAVLEGLTYGFGIWWVMYLYIWPILSLITYFFKKNQTVILWAVISGVFGLTFGALCAIPYAITGGIYAGISYWISGIPFDIMHCIGNIVVMLLLFKPMNRFFIAVSVNKKF